MLTLNLTNADSFLPQDYLTSRKPRLEQAAEMLATHSGPGGDFTGWVTLPRDYDKEEFARIQAAARRIQKQSQVLVVIGIGGSYLGARAVIELLRSPNYNLKQKDTPDVLFTGNGLSTDALLETISLIGDRDFSVNVISKSGTTTESAIAFRIFKGMLEEKYGSRRLLGCVVLTALISGLVQFLLFPGSALLGASGIVFMMIVLSSLAGMREGEVPLTLVLVVLLYLGGEVVDAATARDSVSQLTHIVGGVSGIVFGFRLARAKKR